MDAPLSIYMGFLAIHINFWLNKVLFSWARGRIVSLGAQKYDDQTIFHISQHILWEKIHFNSSREGWASSRRQSKNRRNSVRERRWGEEMMEINGGQWSLCMKTWGHSCRLWPSSTPAGIARHEAKFSNILFRLVIAVFTQYIII